jgi:hypothetical protein
MTFLILLISFYFLYHSMPLFINMWLIASETPRCKRGPSKQYCHRLAYVSLMLGLGDTALNFLLEYTGHTRPIAASDFGFLLCYLACQYSSLCQS